jgi:hypothetical protein
MYIPHIWDTSIEHTYNTIYIINTTTPHQLTNSKSLAGYCKTAKIDGLRHALTT